MRHLVGWLWRHKYADVADAWGFPVLAGEARFVDKDTVEVDGKPLSARRYVIATGSHPHTEGIAGIGTVDYLTSTAAMDLDHVSDSLLVIGGGYVAMEQAQLFAHLGARVTVVGRLAPHAEPELRAVMARVFTDDAIAVLEEHAARVTNTGDGLVTVTATSGREVTGRRMLVAIGRRPDTTALDLAAVGVDTDARGFIIIDAHQRTTNPKVYAAGDVAGTPPYVYVAAAAGRIAATNALAPTGNRPASVDYTGMPRVMFTRAHSSHRPG